MSLVKVGDVYYAKIRNSKTNKIIRKSTGTGNKVLARQVEKGITEALIKGLWSPEANRLTFSEMAEDIENDYAINKRRSGRTLKTYLKSLGKVFGGMKAQEITEAAITDYKLKRLEKGLSNDGVNGQLIILRRMLNLAKENKKLLTVPKITLLKGKVRLGFFSEDEFFALRGCLPDYLKVFLTLAYHTGMRKSEMLGLQWNQVDLEVGKISLTADQTKNETPRIIYLRGELLEAMLKQRDWILKNFPNCSYVFTYDGKKLFYIKRQWKNALKTAGLEGKKLHDMRRTALSNMTRRGIPQITAMKISGHKTASCFIRYQITTEDDIKKAAEVMANYQSVGLKYGHSDQNVGNLEDTENFNLLKVKD